MSCLNNKKFTLKDFKDMQSNLSVSIELLIDFKKFFTEVWAKDFNLEEQMMDTNEQAAFAAKIDKLQEQIILLEKKMSDSREYLISNINILTEHLSRLEKKNMGLTDKIKFWNKPKTAVDKIKELGEETKQANLFNFNED